MEAQVSIGRNETVTSPSSKRYGFLVNTLASYAGASINKPMTRRNSTVSVTASMSGRADHAPWNACDSSARSSFSGAIDTRPPERR